RLLDLVAVAVPPPQVVGGHALERGRQASNRLLEADLDEIPGTGQRTRERRRRRHAATSAGSRPVLPSPTSAALAAVIPLLTAPSIVAGHPVSVHDPARYNPGIDVGALGRSGSVPGDWRNVACRSRVTRNRSAVASRVLGSSASMAGRNCERR